MKYNYFKSKTPENTMWNNVDMGRNMHLMAKRLGSLEHEMGKLQSYVAEQTPFETTPACPYTNCEEDRINLLSALKVALLGLKPNATTHQKNTAWYAVRSILSSEEAFSDE